MCAHLDSCKHIIAVHVRQVHMMAVWGACSDAGNLFMRTKHAHTKPHTPPRDSLHTRACAKTPRHMYLYYHLCTPLSLSPLRTPTSVPA